MAISNGVAPFTGTFIPDRSLTDFNGKQSNGLWELRIYDAASGGNGGTLQNWEICLTGEATSLFVCIHVGASAPESARCSLPPGAWHKGLCLVLAIVRVGWSRSMLNLDSARLQGTSPFQAPVPRSWIHSTCIVCYSFQDYGMATCALKNSFQVGHQ